MAGLVHIGLNALRSRIADYLGDITGSAARILGNVFAELRWPARGHGQFLRWPQLHVLMHDVVLHAPAGPVVARLAHVDLTIRPRSLLRRKIDVALAVLHEPQLHLRRGDSGGENWGGIDPGRLLRRREILPERLEVIDGLVRLTDMPRNMSCVMRVGSTQASDGQAFRCEITGKRLGETIEGHCTVSTTASLRQREVQYLVDAHLWCGDTHLRTSGTLADPFREAVLDVQLSLSGVTMARLFPFTGVVLPESAPFTVEGRASGTLGRQRTHLRYSDFHGKIGSTDIRGTLDYERKMPRPLLRGNVYCVHLHAADLRAVVGTDSGPEQKARRGKRVQPPQKRLPVERFKTERWRNIDVDVEFSARHIIRRKKPELDNLSFHVLLREGVLELKPLRIGVAGGQLIVDMRLDGREDIARGWLSLWARGLRLPRMFTSMSPAGARGLLYGEVRLEGTGNSIHALLASSRGRARWQIEHGAISKQMMDEIGMRLCEIVADELFGDREVPIRRGQAEFHGIEGLMEAGTCVLDTPEVRIDVGGYIDLANETFCLSIWPHNKGASFMLPRLPLVLLGTFNEPDLVINPALTLLRPAAELALIGAATPLVALERMMPGLTGPAQAQHAPDHQGSA